MLTEDNKCANAAALWQITFLINIDGFFVNHTKVMIKPYAVQAKVKAQLVLSLRNDEKANKKKIDTKKCTHHKKSTTLFVYCYL